MGIAGLPDGAENDDPGIGDPGAEDSRIDAGTEESGVETAAEDRVGAGGEAARDSPMVCRCSVGRSAADGVVAWVGTASGRS